VQVLNHGQCGGQREYCRKAIQGRLLGPNKGGETESSKGRNLQCIALPKQIKKKRQKTEKKRPSYNQKDQIKRRYIQFPGSTTRIESGGLLLGPVEEKSTEEEKLSPWEGGGDSENPEELKSNEGDSKLILPSSTKEKEIH